MVLAATHLYLSLFCVALIRSCKSFLAKSSWWHLARVNDLLRHWPSYLRFSLYAFCYS